jgi:hypothetical protein
VTKVNLIKIYRPTESKFRQPWFTQNPQAPKPQNFYSLFLLYKEHSKQKPQRQTMKRRIREFLSLCFSSLHSQNHHKPLSKSLQHTSSFQNSTTFSTFSNSQRDSLILQKFKERKLKGSSKDSIFNPNASNLVPSSFDTNVEKMAQKGLKNESENNTMVVGNFKELGLSEVLVEVMEEIGEFVPSEIQCVVIPTILEGKSLLLSSPSQHDRTLAYLLPLIQVHEFLFSF